jgi:hypothetical protein
MLLLLPESKRFTEYTPKYDCVHMASRIPALAYRATNTRRTDYMRGKLAVISTAVALAGCAAAGGFPKTLPMEADNTVTMASQAIAEAQSAGADSLAHDVLVNAKTHLDEAQKNLISRKPDQAALHAREALADARLARVNALRATAERSQAAAQAALQALPPNGGGR